MNKAGDETGWFDRPRSRRLLWILLWTACASTVVAELMLQLEHRRHGHFGEHSADGWWGAYSVLGFAGCALMIVAAKVLGFWLKKPEDYYQESGEKNQAEDGDESVK